MGMFLNSNAPDVCDKPRVRAFAKFAEDGVRELENASLEIRKKALFITMKVSSLATTTSARPKKKSLK